MSFVSFESPNSPGKQEFLAHFKMRKQFCEAKRIWMDSREIQGIPGLGRSVGWGMSVKESGTVKNSSWLESPVV